MPRWSTGRLLACLLSLPIICMTLACMGGTKDAPPQQIVEPSKDTPSSSANNGGESPSPAPVGEAPSSRAAPDKAARIGDIQVSILSATVGKVPLKDITGDGVSKEELLIVRLGIANTSSTRKIDYKTWSGGHISLGGDVATIRDNFGNAYKRVSFGFGSHPAGAVERAESIYPNTTLEDVLVFERPVKNAAHLDLDLPANNYGSPGVLRFRIPAAGFTPARKVVDSQDPVMPKPAVPDGPPLVLDLPPGSPMPETDPRDPRPLPVRQLLRAQRKTMKYRTELDGFNGAPNQREQLREAATLWDNEVGRLTLKISSLKAAVIAAARKNLQAEAEAKFPTSKTDLKVRARAEAQWPVYVNKGIEELKKKLDAEYKLD